MIRLSVLDQSTVVSGRSPDASIRESISLAQHCEALGYARYWCAEHHNSDSQAGTAPEILIAAIAATTQNHPRRLSRGHAAALRGAESRGTVPRAGRHRAGADRSRAGPGARIGRAHRLCAEPARRRGGRSVSRRRARSAGLGVGRTIGRATRSAISAPSRPGRQRRRYGFSAVPTTARRSRRISGCHTASRISSPTGTGRQGAGGVSRRLPAERPASGTARRGLRLGDGGGTNRKRPGCSSRGRCGASAATAASTPRCPRRRRRRCIRTQTSKRPGSKSCAEPHCSARPTSLATALRALAAEHQVEEIAILTTLHDPDARRRSYALLAEDSAYGRQRTCRPPIDTPARHIL